MGLTNDLRHRVTIYTRSKLNTEFGETDFGYAPLLSCYAAIRPKGGHEEIIEGEMRRANITHVITVRANALPTPQTDAYIMYKDQRYDVLYWQPHYKHNDRVELMCRMVVEA